MVGWFSETNKQGYKGHSIMSNSCQQQNSTVSIEIKRHLRRGFWARDYLFLMTIKHIVRVTGNIKIG